MWNDDMMMALLDVTGEHTASPLRMTPDQEDFDPAEPLEAYPDDATMDVVSFMMLHDRI